MGWAGVRGLIALSAQQIPGMADASLNPAVMAFTMTLAADTTGSLSAYAGNGAAALVGFQLTVIAKASDRFGNAMKGVDVSWSASSGLLQTTSGTTDSTGKATNVITVGPDTGKVMIVASSRFNAITFTVSALHTN